MGRGMDPQKMMNQSRLKASRMIQYAARHSAAYRTLLREHGIDDQALREPVAWNKLPVLTKQNTFGRFALSELARDVPAKDLADVLTSSGRGGRSFGFRLTERAQHEEGWFDIDLGLQDVFGVDQQSTLLVNCLPMGVVFRSRAVAVANVSVREDMACSILRDVGPRFQQTVLCTDPLFIRALLDEAKAADVDWRVLNTSVIIGEESLVESQRDYIAARMGIDLDGDDARLIGSSFGVGELGLNLLFETRETIRIRRSALRHADMATILGVTAAGEAMPSLFCYNPLRSHIEILDPGPDGYGEMCVTMLDTHAVIPLPRYTTGDMARLLTPEEVKALSEKAMTVSPWLPMVAVRGRIKDRPDGMPSVEGVKDCLYQDHSLADQLTGAFKIVKDAGGVVRVVFQARSDAAAEHGEVRGRLLSLLQARWSAEIVVEVLAPMAFPWRPVLDHERKFAYLDPSAS
jgi:phenylacetate-CoA ligase